MINFIKRKIIIYKLTKLLKEHYNYSDNIKSFYLDKNNNIYIYINCENNNSLFTIQTYKFVDLIYFAMKHYNINVIYSYENKSLPYNLKQYNIQ